MCVYSLSFSLLPSLLLGRLPGSPRLRMPCRRRRSEVRS